MSRAPTVVWLLLIAAAAWIVYGSGFVGYDGMYSLLWGSDLLQGRSPDLDAPLAPTPHPLSIVAGAGLSLFGDTAPTLFQGVVVFSFAALAWVAFRLGQELFSTAVGALFGFVLVTRNLLVVETLQASIDIPFLTLVLWAGLLEARCDKRGVPVLVVLSVAGLLRPEAWLLAGAYLAYLLWQRPTQRQGWWLAPCAASAPLVWMSFDLALTGDPLFSLHGTQDLAAQLDRPRQVDTALTAIPDYLEFILNDVVFWGGLAGILAGLLALYERSLLPAAITALGLLGFVALGVFDLPLLIRYLLLPAAMLALFSAVAVLGWANLPQGGARQAWGLGAAVLTAALIVSVPDESRRLDSGKTWADRQREVQEDLHDLVESPSADEWDQRCGRRLHVPNRRVVPMLAYWLDRRPASFTTGAGPPKGGLVLVPANELVVSTLILDPRDPRPPTQRPRGFGAVESNRSWRLYERC